MEWDKQEEVIPGPYSPALPSTLQSESWRSGEERSSSSMSWGRSVRSCCNWVRRVTSGPRCQTHQRLPTAALQPMRDCTQRFPTSPFNEFLKLHMNHAEEGEDMTAGLTTFLQGCRVYMHTSQLTDAEQTLNHCTHSRCRVPQSTPAFQDPTSQNQGRDNEMFPRKSEWPDGLCPGGGNSSNSNGLGARKLC